MGLYKYYPIPSDRMGALWTLLPIKGSCIVEFGTSGTTRFELNGFARMQGHQHSKIYTTHLDESDIAMGKIHRLDEAIAEIVEKENPPVVFVMPSTISAIIGTDIEASCMEYEEKYPNTRFIPVKNDGFKGNWTLGVKNTLNLLATKLPKKREKTEQITFNVIGSCADDYNYHSDYLEIVRILEGCYNAKPLCILTSNTSISDIQAMSSAHINLVLRKEGVLAAKTLEKNFNTPYLLKRPYGLSETLGWIEEISAILNVRPNEDFINAERDEVARTLSKAEDFFRDKTAIIGGHRDVVQGILGFAREEAGLTIAHAWCNCPEMATEDIPFYDEKKWEDVVKNSQYHILMGNAMTLKLGNPSANKVQIDIPNYEYRHTIDPHTPYVGFRGALYLFNKWTNHK